MNLNVSPRVVALTAVGGLLTLAAVAAVDISGYLPLIRTMPLMPLLSTAVVASAILGRQRPGGPPDDAAPGQGNGRTARSDVNGTTPTPMAPADEPPDARHVDEPWLETLLQFAQEALGALPGDRLQTLLAQRLPQLVGREDVWVAVNAGGQQQVILPQQPGCEPRRILSDEPRQWATFPLKADGETVGVLGLDVGHRGITAREWRMLSALANVLGRTLKTAALFEALREATLVDPLTGCTTRGEGMRRLEAELRRAERSNTSVAVMMLDLDHFKSINDRHGHGTGDAVLSAVGGTLLGTLRASDIRSRWGGEEFLVVLPDSNIERASSAAEYLRQRIAATAVRSGTNTVRTTASIGITIARPGETDIPRLLDRADTALYQAKSEGRNRVMVAGADRQVTHSETPPQEEAPPPPSPVAAHSRERRNPSQVDRRSGYGRRRTDVIEGRWGTGNG